MSLAAALAVGCFGLAREREAETPAARPAPAARSLEVTATAYTAAPEQTDVTPWVGAWGHRLEPGTKAVAVSGDLVALGLRPGTEIEIEGLDGRWRVLDRMPDRWSRRIDLFMGTDEADAIAFGKRRVLIRWEP